MLSLVVLSAILAQQPLPTLDELAAEHDLVAITQQIDINYDMVRDFPKEGHGLLRVLIAYKGTERGELIEVREKGLEPFRCYYPDFENEGNRYLVFLNKTEDDQYQGVKPTCQLPLLVTADNAYALLYPVAGVAVDSSLASRQTYADPAAYLMMDDLTHEWIDQQLEAGYIRVEDDHDYALGPERVIYTQGIDVTSLRGLLFPDSSDQ